MFNMESLVWLLSVILNKMEMFLLKTNSGFGTLKCKNCLDVLGFIFINFYNNAYKVLLYFHTWERWGLDKLNDLPAASPTASEWLSQGCPRGLTPVPPGHHHFCSHPGLHCQPQPWLQLSRWGIRAFWESAFSDSKLNVKYSLFHNLCLALCFLK